MIIADYTQFHQHFLGDASTNFAQHLEMYFTLALCITKEKKKKKKRRKKEEEKKGENKSIIAAVSVVFKSLVLLCERPSDEKLDPVRYSSSSERLHGHFYP